MSNVVKLAKSLSLKYAEELGTEGLPVDELEEELPPPATMKETPKAKQQVAIEVIISHCAENGLYPESTEQEYYAWLKRGTSPKQILSIIKSDIESTQQKLNNCKAMIRDWGKLVK